MSECVRMCASECVCVWMDGMVKGEGGGEDGGKEREEDSPTLQKARKMPQPPV